MRFHSDDSLGFKRTTKGGTEITARTGSDIESGTEIIHLAITYPNKQRYDHYFSREGAEAMQECLRGAILSKPKTNG